MTRTALPLALAVLGLVAPPLRADDPPEPAPAQAVAATFDSGGKPIAVEVFEPKGDGKHPAVLIFHGAGGMQIGGPAFLETSRRLAGAGYVAMVVHYFDRTGTSRADGDAMAQHYRTWMDTLADAIAYAKARPDVDPDRVGLVGFSLGAYLALSEASRNEGVAAVAEYFGGLPRELAAGLTKMPPTLILHGDADSVVPVSEAKALEKLLTEKMLPFEIQIYVGAGHGFTGETGQDAFRRVQAFLDKHVRDKPPAAS